MTSDTILYFVLAFNGATAIFCGVLMIRTEIRFRRALREDQESIAAYIQSRQPRPGADDTEETDP